MKLQNLLTQSLLCAALTALPLFSSFAYPTQTAKKPQATQPTKAAEGGASGGGGNASADRKFNSNDIWSLLEDKTRIRPLAESLLYRMHAQPVLGGGMDSVPLKSVLKKLNQYGLKQAAQDIQTVKFVMGPNVKCVDENTNQPVDAYTDTAKKTICFDIQRLGQRELSYSNVDSILGSLIVHEVAHLFGATEAEAQALQDYSSFYKISLNILGNTKIKALLDLTEFLFDVEDIIAYVNSGASTIRVCQALALQSPNAEVIRENLYYEPGINGALLRPYTVLEKTDQLAVITAMNALSYCSQGKERKESDEYFEGRKVVIENGVKIINIAFGNRAELLQSLAEAKKVAIYLLKEVNLSSASGKCTITRDSSGSTMSSCTH